MIGSNDLQAAATKTADNGQCASLIRIEHQYLMHAACGLTDEP